MTKLLENFFTDESGAVTVDWVVLTAAIVGLGIAVLASVSSGVEQQSGDIEGKLLEQRISTTF
jgi:Flp pilus assembly pilin Flp